jgi:hypothetical protein
LTNIEIRTCWLFLRKSSDPPPSAPPALETPCYIIQLVKRYSNRQHHNSTAQTKVANKTCGKRSNGAVFGIPERLVSLGGASVVFGP